MPLNRRQFIGGTGVLALSVSPLAAQEGFPNKPVLMIVGASPGGGTDISGRIAAELLSRELGQSVVVENRPGASSAIAMDYVAKSKPDGYTLVYSNADGATMLPAIRQSLPYSTLNDFTYVARVLQAPEVIAVSAKSQFQNLASLVEYAKANPGKINCGTTGIGSASDLSAYLMESRAGIKMAHIHYKGSGPVLMDLVGGQLDLAMPTISGTLPYVKGGQVKLLAVTSKERDPAIPDVPTTAEAGIADFVVNLWFGLLGPAGMPKATRSALEAAALKAFSTDRARELYLNAGYVVNPVSGAEFREAVAAEMQMWKKLAEAGNISVN
jgi:tripartite-type tricarboxylate transporter receptor subunit TctC